MTDLPALRRVVDGAAAALEASRQRIDDLNVYPVPDGDTGTNLALTLRAVRDSLAELEDGDRPALARALTRAALMGARGNSGVILSQIVRGAADSLGAAPAVDAPAVARALRAASDAAYRAVRRPVEGTMLTEIRELAEEAESRARPGQPLDELLALIVLRGEAALARTPEQLDVLRRAGVVDAGAAGLLEVVRGVHAALAGAPLPEPLPAQELTVDAIHQELSRYTYCTVFVVEGEALDRDALESALEPLGDALLVVGDETALKVHVHTDDPGAALSLGVRAGTVEGVEIANMHRQTVERERRLAAVPDLEPARSAVVAVVAGKGNKGLFESLGAAIVDGSQNPSTADILAAVEAMDAPEAIVLPNNPNVVLAAEQAAGLAARPVHVVPARSLQAGLAALVVFDETRDAARNVEEMRRALEALSTGAVTVSSRDIELDGVAVPRGAWLGLIEGEPAAGGAGFDEVAAAVAGRLLAGGAEVLTLLTGADEPPLEALLERLEREHPDVVVDVHEGGQPHYPLLLAAE